LAVEAAVRRFGLARDITANPENPCRYSLRVQVVELAKDGRPLGSLLLVDAVRDRECGE
jgi:hypothetical protein